MARMAGDDDLPPEADALYGLPLEDFVPERDALAKRLRQAKDRETAKRVAGLRKPSIAAWTVNQLARSRGRDVQELVDAGDRLRQAQAAILEGGGSGADLRAARDAEREAVEQLVRLAAGLLPGGREPAAATLDRVGATLHAVATDDDVRRDVLAGRLLQEREPAGFGDLESALAASIPAAAPAEEAPARRRGGRAPKQRDAAVDRRAREREERERRAALRQALKEAVTERERAEHELAEADAEHERAEEALAAARDRLDAAQARVREARAEEDRRRGEID
jgi:exonuclease VII small subunit